MLVKVRRRQVGSAMMLACRSSCSLAEERVSISMPWQSTCTTCVWQSALPASKLPRRVARADLLLAVGPQISSPPGAGTPSFHHSFLHYGPESSRLLACLCSNLCEVSDCIGYFLCALKINTNCSFLIDNNSKLSRRDSSLL